ncbi:hypothetical protein [Lyngbya sp. CCY1209]|uniref:hypothetical protein n=1 Tax=Lyngbya sp. CCY1209 TaxID=2886103 RepID=UPI002D212DA0|nr:hypothetical protein [Lyngbya sp. CCY1209]MEB3882101.1 hypothetical protein [Lyngbya sp. CCY1209]
MIPTADLRQKAIALIGQLSPEKLSAVVQLLECLTEPPQQNPTSAEEIQLLEVIRDRLPEDESVRLNTLRDRCECGKLSEAEHRELIRYEDLLEQRRVRRLEALMALAKITRII